MSGVFKKAQINSIPDVKQLAKMVEPVITQQLGMDLQHGMVILLNINSMILRVGANNYFLLHYMAALQHISRKGIISRDYFGAPYMMK